MGSDHLGDQTVIVNRTLIDGLGEGVKVARRFIGATRALIDVTNAIVILVGRAISPAVAEGIDLVPRAVTVAIWDVGAAAVINGARTVADAAGINLSDTVIDIVA